MKLRVGSLKRQTGLISLSPDSPRKTETWIKSGMRNKLQLTLQIHKIS